MLRRTFTTAAIAALSSTALASRAFAQDAATPAEAPAAPAIMEMTMGAEDAPVTFIEYASFTCPHCASFHANQFKQLKADYIDTGKVKFIYRDVYFDRFGLWAAMIARCGDNPQRFFGIADVLYTTQQEWIAGGQDPALIANNLRGIGRQAGLNDATIDACMNDAAMAQALVTWFEENADKDNVRGTPTLFINGKQHSNMAYDELKKLIDAELS